MINEMYQIYFVVLLYVEKLTDMKLFGVNLALNLFVLIKIKPLWVKIILAFGYLY